MSDGEIATALVLFGALIGLRFDVFAVFLFTIGVVVTLVTRGVQAGDGGLMVALQAVVGMMLFQGSYLLAAMLVSAKRRTAARLRAGRHVPHEKDHR